MFIKPNVADERVSSEDNLVNLVLSISRSSKLTSETPELTDDDSTSNNDDSTAPITPEVVGSVRPHYPGRNVGGKEVSLDMKHLAGLLTQTDTIKDVANALGLNVNTVAQSKHGRTTHGQENPELKARLDESLAVVRDKAMDRLLASLDLLEDEKISKASAKDIAAISANMAKVMSSTLPKENNNNINAQLIVYAPTQINESRFEVVEV